MVHLRKMNKFHILRNNTLMMFAFGLMSGIIIFGLPMVFIHHPIFDFVHNLDEVITMATFFLLWGFMVSTLQLLGDICRVILRKPLPILW